MSSLAAVQSGISEAIRRQRLLLFGNNEIDVKAKSTISLLIDEVLFHSVTEAISHIRAAGDPSIFCLPNCKHYSMVTGQLLLLCILHRCDIFKHRHGNPVGNKKGTLEVLVVNLSAKVITLW